MEYLQYSVSSSYSFILTSVLNLVINGIPSIQFIIIYTHFLSFCFKPCYKWNTFNTLEIRKAYFLEAFGFKPCYKWNTFNTIKIRVCNLASFCSFKPCYKWNTFNTFLSLLLVNPFCLF